VLFIADRIRDFVHSWVPGGWTAVFKWICGAMGWAWGKIASIPPWVPWLIAIGLAGALWFVISRSCRIYEAYRERNRALQKQVNALAQKLEQNEPYELPPIQEIWFKGLVWRRTNDGPYPPRGVLPRVRPAAIFEAQVFRERGPGKLFLRALQQASYGV